MATKRKTLADPTPARKPRAKAPPDMERVPQPGGRGALLRGGVPGNRGGMNYPDAFKAKMRELANRAVQALELSKILEDPTSELYLPAAKWAADYGFGKPVQQVEVSGEVGSYIAEVPAKVASADAWARTHQPKRQ